MDPSVIFTWIIAVLAAIRRAIDRHRNPPVDPTGRWWRERGAIGVPERWP
jgi:hypothetical protein